MTTTASPARPDTEVVFNPATYTSGVPFDALARLRRLRDRPPIPAHPAAWDHHRNVSGYR